MGVDLEGLSKDEILAEVHAAAVEGRLPFEQQACARQSAAVEGDEDPEAFVSGDLAQDHTLRREAYTLPGTSKRLWVGPMGTAQLREVLRATIERCGTQAPARDEKEASKRLLEAQYVQRVYQVIACCYRGPGIKARRSFTQADFHALDQRLGHATIKEIVEISERLAGSEESLGAGVRAFFGHARRCLQTLRSASAIWESCPPGLQDSLTRFESLVSRALTRGSLGSSILSELDELPWNAE